MAGNRYCSRSKGGHADGQKLSKYCTIADRLRFPAAITSVTFVTSFQTRFKQFSTTVGDLVPGRAARDAVRKSVFALKSAQGLHRGAR